MTSSKRDVSGLILAGGASRRFGSDKSRHPLAGRPMIEYVFDAMNGVVEDVFVSVARADMFTGLPVEHLTDRFPDAGPLAGLHAGLLRCRTSWLLAAACDMPFLTRGVLERLMDARSADSGPVVARSSDGCLQPLCALYPKGMLAAVETALQEGRYALLDLLDQVGPVTEISVLSVSVRNINRPQDLYIGTDQQTRSERQDR